jgi:hypothetical protein
MHKGALVRVIDRRIRAGVRAAAPRRTAALGRIDGTVETIFIEWGALGVVIDVGGGASRLITFGDRTCWLDSLSLEVLSEAG